MSIDALAREMSQATRDDVARSLDVEASLQQLRVVRRRRRRVKVASGLAAAAAVGAVVLGSLPGSPTGQENDVRPAGTPDGSPSSSSRTTSGVNNHCLETDVIRCLGASRLLVRAEVPYTITVPPSFSRIVDMNGPPHVVDVRGKESADVGVTVLTGVRPVDASFVRGAEAVARWVGARDFLLASRVRPGSLDGRETWNVDVRLAPDETGKADPCNQLEPACRPLLEQPARSHFQTGIWDRMVSRYSFFDLPGLGTVAVWSWVSTQDGQPSVDDETLFDRHARLVESIDFRL